MVYDPGPDTRLPEQMPPQRTARPVPALLVAVLACLLFCGTAEARRIQDSPDGFPTDGQECAGLQFWRWTARGPVLVCIDRGWQVQPERTEEDQPVLRESLTLTPAEDEIPIYADYCTDTDTECKTAITKACNDDMGRPSGVPIDFQAYTFSRAEKVCTGLCPNGKRATCTVEEVNPKPKPKPRDPNEV